MSYHGEVVAIELQDLVIDQETWLAGSTVWSNISHIDTIICIPLSYESSLDYTVRVTNNLDHLGTLPVVLVYSSTNFEATLEFMFRYSCRSIFVEDDWYGETRYCCAWFMWEWLALTHFDSLNPLYSQSLDWTKFKAVYFLVCFSCPFQSLHIIINLNNLLF